MIKKYGELIFMAATNDALYPFEVIRPITCFFEILYVKFRQVLICHAVSRVKEVSLCLPSYRLLFQFAEKC